MLAVVPQPTFRSLPLRAPDRRARRCTEPSLGADRPSPEHKPAAAPRLLSRTRPSGEVVPRAQARVVQREVRDRRITARGVKLNALALLGRSCPPTTPHRFLLVGGSRRCVMTSITWIGISIPASTTCRDLTFFSVSYLLPVLRPILWAVGRIERPVRPNHSWF